MVFSQWRDWMKKKRSTAVCRGRTRRLILEPLEDRTLLDASFIISGLYQAILHQAPDPAGLAGWSALLNAGTTPEEVANLITTSHEATLNHVRDLYSEILGRDPDPAGFNSWVGFLESGGNLNQAEAGFLASDEFFLDAGQTNQGFLSALYGVALDREIDSSGQSSYSSWLASGASRYIVAKSVVNSLEANRNVVTGFYHEFLGREPDPGGLNAFVALIHADGDDPRLVLISALIGSTEGQITRERTDYFPNVPAAPGIYLQARDVERTGFEHTFLRVVQDLGNGQTTTFTISAFDVAGQLKFVQGVQGALNAVNDTYLPVEYQQKLSLNGDLNQAINELLSLAHTYNNHAEQYYFAPGIPGISPTKSFNSNSFIAGLLHAAGIQLPDKLNVWGGGTASLNGFLAPGIGKQVPAYDFAGIAPPPIQADPFAGTYQGTYTGTAFLDNGLTYPINGPVAFTEANGVISVTVPATGSGALSSTGSASFTSVVGIATSGNATIDFSGTFTVTASGVVATGSWSSSFPPSGPIPGGTANGTWQAVLQ